jgi:hypothetical protein
VGSENSREELEEPLTLRASVKEGPGESGLDHEGRDFASEWYQSRFIFAFCGRDRREIHHAA